MSRHFALPRFPQGIRLFVASSKLTHSFARSLLRFGGILGDDPPRGIISFARLHLSPFLSSDSLLSLSLDRTGILRRDGYPSRHLGPVQMTTDTALGVTKLCVQDGRTFPFLPPFFPKNQADFEIVGSVRLDEIKFVDHPTIRFPGEGYENESVEMPFRYVVDSKTGEPILPEGMREHLR